MGEPVNNLHIYPSTFVNQSRMLKETRSLAESGLVDNIFVGAIWEAGLEEHQTLDPRRQVWRVPLKSKTIRIPILAKLAGMAEWGYKLLRGYGKQPMHIVQCHSLSCLPIGVAFKLLYGSKLVYDCHELETETANSKGVRRILARVVERLLIPFADRVMVVGEKIRQWYEEKYARGDIVLLRNVPYRSKIQNSQSDLFRRIFDLQENDILFIYQGVFAEVRFTHVLLRLFAQGPADKHIVFMGSGDLEQMVKDHADTYANIHFKQAVPLEEILQYTSSADVGLSILEGGCLNHLFCLPNKFFEYLMAGLPVLASDFPEMGAFIDEHGCGWRAPMEEDALRRFIAALSWEEVAAKKAKAVACQKYFSWEDESRKLLEVYRGLVASR